MRKLNLIIGKVLVLCCTASILSGCTLMGLDVQEDYNRDPHTLDPHINITAWEFIKKRANAGDKLFERMMAGIVYSEIDTNEYMKPNRTFLVLNKDAVSKTSTGTWQSFLVNNKAASSWTSYSKEFVKNYLLYLIIDGVYDHYTLPPTASVKVQTLSPKGYWSALPTGVTLANFVANPESTLYLRVSNGPNGNTQDYPIVVNDNSNNVRTSDILATNGTIHVVDKFVTPILPTIFY